MKIVVIGLGSMGKRRIRLMQSMKLPVDIIGVDNREERCAEVQSQFGIECYGALDEAESRTSIDCAFVCTSPLAHANIIKTCLLHGYHVFTEINLVDDQYDTNIALAKQKNLTLFLSSTPIYQETMVKITEEIKRNGNPVSYLYHVGQYLPDWHPWEQYQDFFVGSKQTNGCREILAIELPWMVKAFGKIQNVNTVSNRLTRLDINFPDIYLVQLTHENGNQGMLAVDVVCRKPVRKLEVFNEELYLEWEGTPQSLKKQDIEKKDLVNIGCVKYYNETGYSELINECGYVNEIKEFFDVLNGKRPEYTMEMDAHILNVIDQIEGIKSGEK